MACSTPPISARSDPPRRHRRLRLPDDVQSTVPHHAARRLRIHRPRLRRQWRVRRHLFRPAPIPPGGTAVFDYQMMFNPPYPITPPGDYGYIDLDFGGNGVFDATYFGPLRSPPEAPPSSTTR